MVYYIHLLKGLLAPQILFFQLGKVEEIRGLWKRAAILVFLSVLLFSLSSFFGLGMDFLSKEITEIGRQELEAKKLFIFVGQMVWGLFYALLVIFGVSLVLWALLDMQYKKIVVIQLFVLSIFLLEKTILLPIRVSFGIGPESSPLSLGVIAQYFTANTIVVYAFSQLSIFKLWAIFFQYKGLKALSDKNPKIVLLLIVIVNLFIWITSALLSYLKLERLI